MVTMAKIDERRWRNMGEKLESLRKKSIKGAQA
jgi:hypothetical protein